MFTCDRFRTGKCPFTSEYEERCKQNKNNVTRGFLTQHIQVSFYCVLNSWNFFKSKQKISTHKKLISSHLIYKKKISFDYKKKKRDCLSELSQCTYFIFYCHKLHAVCLIKKKKYFSSKKYANKVSFNKRETKGGSTQTFFNL